MPSKSFITGISGYFIDLVSLFNGISTFESYLIQKLYLQINSSSTIYTHSWGNKSVHAFPKGISLKVNVIVQLKFECTMTSQSSKFIHYATGTSLVNFRPKWAHSSVNITIRTTLKQIYTCIVFFLLLMQPQKFD